MSLCAQHVRASERASAFGGAADASTMRAREGFSGGGTAGANMMGDADASAARPTP